jgi:hypothetical protein
VAIFIGPSCRTGGDILVANRIYENIFRVRVAAGSGGMRLIDRNISWIRVIQELTGKMIDCQTEAKRKGGHLP